jgi:hypothetical protein
MDEFATIATAYPAYSPDQARQAVYDLEVANKKIADLENLLSAQRRIISVEHSKIDNAKALILEAYDVDDFSEDRIQAIAEALEIELTKEYDVTITVTFSGSVTLPLGVDVDDIENYVDFDAEVNRYKDDVEVDLFSDGVDVRVNN